MSFFNHSVADSSNLSYIKGMKENINLEITFPSDWDYIPAIRRFIAEATLIEGFNQKFSYRTEVIVDELCNNAVKYGPNSTDAVIVLGCELDNDAVKINIKDSGGEDKELNDLKKAIESNENSELKGHGLEIVKMLASDIRIDTDENGDTVVKVVKRRSSDPLDVVLENMDD